MSARCTRPVWATQRQTVTYRSSPRLPGACRARVTCLPQGRTRLRSRTAAPAVIPLPRASLRHRRLERSLLSREARYCVMTARAQPIQTPFSSETARPRDSVEGAGSTHQLDVLMLDQVQHWTWDDILFVECGDGWAAE